MNKVLNIVRMIISIITVTIFSILFAVLIFANYHFLLGILATMFGFILIGTTLVDIFKKRNFSTVYSIVTTIVMIITLWTMLRPLLDIYLISSDLVFTFDIPLSNVINLFLDNMLIYFLIFTSIFIGNYISYKR